MLERIGQEMGLPLLFAAILLYSASRSACEKYEI